jgi:hypothetical protein
MYKSFLLSILLQQCSAFAKGPPVAKTFNYAGETKPLNYFDPLKLSYSKDEKQLQYLRETELQHGRMAMLAYLAFPAIEYVNSGSSAVNFLSSQDIVTQIPFWFTVMLFEVARMRTYWEDPFKTNNFFTIKDNKQPGNILNVDSNKVTTTSYDKELNNGRLAMLAVAHMFGSELLTNSPTFTF